MDANVAGDLHQVACCDCHGITAIHVNSASSVAVVCNYYVHRLFALQCIAASQARAVLRCRQSPGTYSPGIRPGIQCITPECPIPGD